MDLTYRMTLPEYVQKRLKSIGVCVIGFWKLACFDARNSEKYLSSIWIHAIARTLLYGSACMFGLLGLHGLIGLVGLLVKQIGLA